MNSRGITMIARPLRLDIEGGWYHTTNRDLEKRRIFCTRAAMGERIKTVRAILRL
jgi:hypothetical protein